MSNYYHFQPTAKNSQPVSSYVPHTVSASSPIQGYAAASNRAMIELVITATATALTYRPPMPKKNTAIFEDDPEIAAMSDSEIYEAAMAMFGAWADRDDITDDDLANLWSGWGDRLDEIHTGDQPDIPL